MAYIGQGAEGNFTTANAKDTFSGDGSTVVFTLSAGASTNNVDVLVNNVRQEPTTAYSVDGTTLTFTEAPGSGTDNIYVVNRGPAQLTASHPASQALEAYSGDFTTDVTIGGAFTSQGIDDNASSTAVTIDSSGNVLVGKSATDSTTAGVDLRPEGVGVFVRDGNRPLIVNRLTNDGELIQFRKDGTTVGSIGNDGANRLIVNSENTTGYLAVDGAVKFRWRTNDFIPHDNGTKDLGTSATRWKDLYLGGGVYVGGTGSANKLDDYEEGTWAPTYFGATAAGTTSYSFRDGAYTKIGNIVHVTAIMGVSSATGTGNAKIGGLPFTSLSQGNGYYPPLNWAYNNGISFTNGYQLAGYVARNSTEIVLTQFNSSGAVGGVPLDSSFAEIDFSVTYHTT